WSKLGDGASISGRGDMVAATASAARTLPAVGDPGVADLLGLDDASLRGGLAAAETTTSAHGEAGEEDQHAGAQGEDRDGGGGEDREDGPDGQGRDSRHDTGQPDQGRQQTTAGATRLETEGGEGVLGHVCP